MITVVMMVVKKQKISVLGCGWLGFSLAMYLLDKNYIAKGSTTSVDKKDHLKSNNIDPFLIDIDSLNLNSKFFNTDILIIAITSKNIESFQRLVLEIEKSTVKKVIFISSTSVYSTSETPITEESETLKTPLALIEKLFLSNTIFKTTIIRFGGLFGGERQPGNFFKTGREIKNPEGVVNMIHRDDCIAIIEQVIEKESWNHIYNACSDSHPTRRVFYTKAKQNLGFEVPVFEENKHIEMKLISSETLMKNLNYNFIYSDLLSL